MPRISPPLPFRLCICALAATLAWGGHAGAAEPDSPPVDNDGWSVRQHENDESVELVTRSEAGAFGAICAEGSCVLFIEPTKGCDPGSVYPVMANSATTIAMVESSCQRVTESRTPGGPIRTLATLAPSPALMTSIAKGERIALAFPQTEGDVDVLAVETSGMRDAMRSADGIAPAALDEPAALRRGMHPAAVY